jgi:hypothetical protein
MMKNDNDLINILNFEQFGGIIRHFFEMVEWSDSVEWRIITGCITSVRNNP